MYQFGTPFFFVGRRPFEGPRTTKVPDVASLMVRSPGKVPCTRRYQFGAPFFLSVEGPSRDHTTPTPFFLSVEGPSRGHTTPTLHTGVFDGSEPYKVPATTRSPIVNVPDRDSCRSKALRGTTQHQLSIVASLMVRSPIQSANYNTGSEVRGLWSMFGRGFTHCVGTLIVGLV